MRYLGWLNLAAGIMDVGFFIARLTDDNKPAAIGWMFLAVWSFTVAFKILIDNPDVKEEK